jgi:hypothetical protein
MAFLRELALELLDDENGITDDAWRVLYGLFEASDEEYEGIVRALKGTEGRVYLRENHGLEM